MEEKIISYLRKYIPAFAVMGIATWIILALRGQSPELAQDVRYLNLADAFTIPSVIMLMVGVLVWVAGKGTFDMLTYGISRAATSLIPGFKGTNEKFYDYKMRKAEKPKMDFVFLLISGGVYFIPAIVFNILYYTL